MTEEHRQNDDAWPRRAKWAFVAFASIGVFFLLAEHRAHALPWLPWLILAACPLMHVFMHGSHGGHHSHRDGGSERVAGDARSDENGPAGIRDGNAGPKGGAPTKHEGHP